TTAPNFLLAYRSAVTDTIASFRVFFATKLLDVCRNTAAFFLAISYLLEQKIYSRQTLVQRKN
ncbi:hypothetical protein, partial [Actinobacillus ureae]|uniref:hypothetical protein n=1 Tax=Actinobacillus ureae TaxID=723 RepID=UPI001AD81A96